LQSRKASDALLFIKNHTMSAKPGHEEPDAD